MAESTVALPSAAMSSNLSATHSPTSITTHCPSRSSSSSSSPPSSDSSSRRPKRTRAPYIRVACDLCRTRKKRCDWDQILFSPSGATLVPPPSCSNCAAAHRPCVLTAKALPLHPAAVPAEAIDHHPYPSPVRPSYLSSLPPTPTPSETQASHTSIFYRPQPIPSWPPSTSTSSSTHSSVSVASFLSDDVDLPPYPSCSSYDPLPHYPHLDTCDVDDDPSLRSHPSYSPPPPWDVEPQLLRQATVSTEPNSCDAPHSPTSLPLAADLRSGSASHPPSFPSPPPSPSSSPHSSPLPAFQLPPPALTQSYLSTYFSLLNRGLYFFLDEAAFYAAFDAVHVQHSSPPCPIWQLCLSAVLAVGARMCGATDYSDYAAARARRLSERFHHPCDNCDCRALPSSDLALAYRSSLLLSYYQAAMDQSPADVLAVAAHLYALPGVAPAIPHAVRMLADLMPNVPAAYTAMTAQQLGGGVGLGAGCSCRVSVASPSSSSSGSSCSCCCASTSPAASACSPATGGAEGEDVAALLRQQAAVFPLDRWKYYKVKRSLAAALHLPPTDDELAVGVELDSSLDVAVDLDPKLLRTELAAINFHITALLADKQVGGKPPGEAVFSVYNFLALLLKAEANGGLTGHQRVGVVGRQAVCYQLLGRREAAVRCARAAVSLLCESHEADPAACRLPPFAPSFIRCIAILGEWDWGEGSGELIKRALVVTGVLAALWPSVARVEAELKAHMTRWLERQMAAVHTQLQACRRRLELRVMGGEEEGEGGGLTDAASEFVDRSNELRALLQKRKTLCLLAPPEGQGGVGVGGPVRRASAGSLPGPAWSAEDDVSEAFCQSLKMDEDPLQTRSLTSRLGSRSLSQGR